MAFPTAPYSSTNVPDSYFSGHRRFVRGSSDTWPILPDFLRDIFDRIDHRKNGRVTISDLANSIAVTFTTAYADNDYSAVATAVENTVGFANVNVFITAKTATGFTIRISAAPGAGNSVDVNWVAVHDT